MGAVWQFIVGTALFAMSFQSLSEANDARNWPTQIAWVLVAGFFFLSAIAWVIS